MFLLHRLIWSEYGLTTNLFLTGLRTALFLKRSYATCSFPGGGSRGYNYRRNTAACTIIGETLQCHNFDYIDPAPQGHGNIYPFCQALQYLLRKESFCASLILLLLQYCFQPKHRECLTEANKSDVAFSSLCFRLVLRQCIMTQELRLTGKR